MARNRKIKLTSGPSVKGQISFNPLSTDANPESGVNLQGPDTVGASPLTITLPATVVNNGVIQSSTAGVLSSALLVDANVSATAGIAVSKIVAQTPSRALATDASGFQTPSATTSTELGYVSGVTSAVQTQINTTNTNLGTTNSNLTAHTSASGSVHGITGSVVGTTDTQTLTNKTINDTSNTLSVRATSIKSGAAPSGNLLTADGAGNSAWVASSTNFVHLIGAGHITSASGNRWIRTGTSLGAFTASGTSNSPVVDFNAGVGTIQTTSTNLPQFTVNGLVAGTYRVEMGPFGVNPAGSPTLAINDGTTTFNGVTGNAGVVIVTAVWGIFVYGSTQASRTFSIYGADSTSSTTIYADLVTPSGLYFSITRLD
jgi:hypothetical protein